VNDQVHQIDREIRTAPAVTNQALRNELWEARHRVAALQLEIQLTDEGYAALAARIAAEQDARSEAEQRATRLEEWLQQSRNEIDALLVRLAEQDANLVEIVTLLDATVTGHAHQLAGRLSAERAWSDALAAYTEAATQRDAMLASRTFRWTRPARWVRRRLNT